MSTISVKDSNGNPVAVELPLAPGRLAASASRPVALSNEDKASIDALLTAKYKSVAASSTATVLGTTGATGDYVSGLLVIPTSVNPGNVIILDNAISMTVFAGGTGSVSNLVPFFIPLGAKSVSGAWKVTTGASVSVIAIGNFT